MNNSAHDSLPHKRIRRWRFSSRAFLILIVLLCVVLGWVTQRARQQKRICEQLQLASISYELTDPPWWVQFLPLNLLNVDEGHWFRSAKNVSLRFDPKREEVKQIFNTLETRLSLLAELLTLHRLDIRCVAFSDDLLRMNKVLSHICSIHGLQKLSFQADEVGKVLEALPTLPYLTSLSLMDQSWRSYYQSPDDRCHDLIELRVYQTSVKGCSFQPLSRMARLNRLTINRTTLSTDQLHAVELLRPTLAEFHVGK